MSDYNDKERSRIENIASMEGRTTYCEPWGGGPSSDAKSLREVAAPLALALIRRHRGDIDPVLLQIYVTGHIVGHTRIVDAYLFEQPMMSDMMNALTQLACMVGLAIVAGNAFDDARIRRVCELAGVSEGLFQAIVRDALRWLWPRVDDAARRYVRASQMHEFAEA